MSLTNAAAHLEGLVTAGVSLLLPQSSGLLVGCRQLVPLEHQRLLELLLRLRLQQLLPEGDVGEEGGERPAQLHRRFGAFLRKSRGAARLNCERINSFSKPEQTSCKYSANGTGNASIAAAMFCAAAGNFSVQTFTSLYHTT